jgi:DMSO/TMAO reductase YedYZ heme-binding membrane subunit
MSNRAAARTALVAIYVTALTIPAYHFFSARGGIGTFRGLEPSVFLQLFFPIFGLIAFTLVTFQVLIATNLRWLTRVWPQIIVFHRAQGTFALLFAFLHPFFILAGYGVSNYIHYRFVAPGNRIYLIPAYMVLTILILTVTTAHIAWWGRNLPFWRKLHKLNYLVFPLAWLHSWFLGSDVRSSGLRYLWILYALLIGLSIYGSITAKARSAETSVPTTKTR